MEARLAAYLAKREPIANKTAVWDNGRLPLQIAAYSAEQLPPLDAISQSFLEIAAALQSKIGAKHE